MHLSYNRGKNDSRGARIDEPQEVNGVKFYRVGHNASHEFYVGTDGTGKRFRYSVGESCTVDDEGNPLTLESIVRGVNPGLDRDVREVTEFSGYYGHF